MSNSLIVKAKKSYCINGAFVWYTSSCYEMKKTKKFFNELGKYKNVMVIKNELGKDHVVVDGWNPKKDEFFNEYFIIEKRS